MRALYLLGSHRLAVFLLGLTGAVSLLGGTLPQAGRLSSEQQARWETEWSTLSTWLDGLRLTDVFGSGGFLVLVALLSLSLTAGVALSAHTRWRACRQLPGRTCLRALLGIPLLHLGLLLVIAGGAVTMWGGFDAHLELTEGEVYAGEPGKLAVVRGAAPEAFPATLRLDGMRVEIEQGRYLAALDAAITYQLSGGPVQQAQVRTNEPLPLAEYRLFPDNTFGYSVILERHLEDGSRRLMLINFPVPRAEWGASWEVSRNKRIDWPDSPPLYLRMKLSGPDTPAFSLAVSGGADFEGVLRPGEQAELGGFTLQFRGVAPWFGFYLARDPGQGVVFAGALLALAGLAAHLVAPVRVRRRRLDAQTMETGFPVQAGRAFCLYRPPRGESV